MTRRTFYGVSAIVFAASAATTIASCASMSAMGEMQMPGGWTMSIVWMRMPGQTWLGAAASFVGMWVVMMVAMMLPSLTPTLWRYREAVGETSTARLGVLTALVGAGYFSVWAAFGTVVFPLGMALAAVVMREPALARLVPGVAGAVVLIAGVLHYATWKARNLALRREAADERGMSRHDVGTAWRHGLCLGLHCVRSCAGLTMVVLALGVMDVRVMVAATVAITFSRSREIRLAPLDI